MKLFTKISLGIAAFFAVVAVVCSLLAIAMGFSAGDFIKMTQDGKFSIEMGDGKLQIFGFKEGENFEFDWDFSDDDEGLEFEDGESYDVTGEYKNLDIEFGAGQLEIYYADIENIQVLKSDIKGFELKTNETSKTLSIEAGLNTNANEGAKLVILVPRGTSFKKVDLEVGAGQAIIKELMVESLDVEVGAGQVEIELAGFEKDYSYDVNCGIGNVVIGDTSLGGFGANSSVDQDGAKGKINVECGVGEVIIRFVKDSII